MSKFKPISGSLTAASLLATLGVCWPPSAYAMDGELQMFMDMDLQQLLDQPVFTASKKLQTVREAPSTISVFRRRDIDALGVTSLVDILNYAPGLEVSMGPNGRYRVAIRGERKDGNILLLIDNQPINDAYAGHAFFDMPVSFIERVEIIRGPGSALYGTNAVAGVINIISRSDSKEATLHAGTHDSAGIDGLYALALGDGSLDVMLGLSTTAGANETLTVNDTTLSSHQQSGTTNRFLDQGYLNLKYGVGGWEWLLYNSLREQGTWVSQVYDFGPDTDITHQQINSSLGYRWQADQLTITPKIYAQLIWYDADLQDHPEGAVFGNNVFPDGALTRERYQARTVGLDLQAEYAVSEQLGLLAGVVAENQALPDYKLDRNYRVAGMVPQDTFANHDNVVFQQEDRSRDIQAYYGQADYRWHDIQLTLGMRYDRYSDFGEAFNPRLGLVWHPAKNLTIKGLYGEAFRAPTFRELYDDTRVGNSGVKGNAELEPETVKTSELGFEYNVSNWVLRGSAFYNETDDLIGIFDEHGSGGRATIENIGYTRSYGGELELTWVIQHGVQFFVNAARQHTEFFWGDNPVVRNEMIWQRDRGDSKMVNMPRIRVNAGGEFSWQRWQGFVGIQYGNISGANNRSALESYRGHRGENIRIDAYYQASLSLAYQLSEGSRIRLAANNLGGGKYSDPDESNDIVAFGTRGMRQPGETWVLSWQWQLP